MADEHYNVFKNRQKCLKFEYLFKAIFLYIKRF